MARLTKSAKEYIERAIWEKVIAKNEDAEKEQNERLNELDKDRLAKVDKVIDAMVGIGLDEAKSLGLVSMYPVPDKDLDTVFLEEIRRCIGNDLRYQLTTPEHHEAMHEKRISCISHDEAHNLSSRLLLEIELGDKKLKDIDDMIANIK